MKNLLLTALALILVQAAPAQPATPELRYEPPANFYRSASSPPDDYSATDVNAGLQVYPFRQFTGDVEQAFRRTLLRDWVDPRFREGNVMAPPDFRPGSVAGARLVLSARFTENVGGVARQRQRLLVVAGDAAAIIDASAATLLAWQQILPRLNAMSASTRVESGRPAPAVTTTTTVPATAQAGVPAGIAGLYAGTRKSYIPDLMRGVGYGSYVPTPHYYLFSADGRVYRAFNDIAAPQGLERFDFEAARRSDPDNSGRYTVQGRVLHIRMGQGPSAEAIETALPQGERLTIQAVPYERQKPTLSGRSEGIGRRPQERDGCGRRPPSLAHAQPYGTTRVLGCAVTRYSRLGRESPVKNVLRSIDPGSRGPGRRSNRLWLACALWVFGIGCPCDSLAQGHEASVPRVVLVRALRMLDVRSGKIVEDAALIIEGERIKAVGVATEILKQTPAAFAVLDLGNVTVLPGLIDAHTHLMARIPEGDGGYALNLVTKSQAYRALEGAANARATLQAGFTTVRDVGNEGSHDADVALRDVIDRGLIEGPRMRVATRAIAAVGQYHPFGTAANLDGVTSGAQMVSGVDEARRAVREQIGRGADLIKVYADWSAPTLTVAELQVVVEEAHKAGRKVAAHATTAEGVRNAVAAGVDSIEHGTHADQEVLRSMKDKGVFLVPTLAVMDAWAAKSPENAASPQLRSYLEGARRTVEAAHAIGVKIVNGSDPSESDRHGKNAEELVAMTKRGLSALEAIQAATTLAADLLGMIDLVGTLEAGKYADLIAVEGNPLHDVATLLRVRFVMKGGLVIKNDQPLARPAR